MFRRRVAHQIFTLISWTTAVATDHLNGWIFNDLHGLFGPRKTFSDLQCFLRFFLGGPMLDNSLMDLQLVLCGRWQHKTCAFSMYQGIHL